jgi:hypothetical protein
MVDDDLFVPRNCKPDVDAKAGAVMVLFTPFLQPFDFTVRLPRAPPPMARILRKSIAVAFA